MGAARHAGIEALQLAAPHDAANLGIAHVVGRVGEDEIRIELRIRGLVFVAQRRIVGFAHHSVRTQHAHLLIHLGVVGTHHAAFDGAHVVRVIEREIGDPAEAAEFFPIVGGAMRLAHVFDQGNVPALEFAHQLVGQAVKALYVGEEYGTGAFGDFGENLRRIHRQRTRVNVGEHRREAVLQHRRNVRYPGQRRHDHFTAFGMADLQERHRQQVGRRARIDEHAVLHTEPARPLFLERTHVGAVRQDRIVLLQVHDHRVEVFAQDVVAHQGEFHLTSRRSNRRIRPRWCCGCRRAAAPFRRRETRLPARPPGSLRWWCTSTESLR